MASLCEELEAEVLPSVQPEEKRAGQREGAAVPAPAGDRQRGRGHMAMALPLDTPGSKCPPPSESPHLSPFPEPHLPQGASGRGDKGSISSLFFLAIHLCSTAQWIK